MRNTREIEGNRARGWSVGVLIGSLFLTCTLALGAATVDSVDVREEPRQIESIMTIGYTPPHIRENPLLRREERSMIVSPPAHTGGTTLRIFFLLLLIMLSVGLVLAITLT